jgi:hypothetical protein
VLASRGINEVAVVIDTRDRCDLAKPVHGPLSQFSRPFSKHVDHREKLFAVLVVIV